MKIFKYVLSAAVIAVLSLVQVSEASSVLTEKGYKLDKMLVFSRHNIRSPLTGAGSAADTMTPNKWFKWTAPTGQLSLHGGMAETSMGQYFRKYLEDESFMPENWRPEENQVRFYANSYQRTIATAQYFSSGMLPIANVPVERKKALNARDSVFLIDGEVRGEKLLDKIIEYNNTAYGQDSGKICAEVAGDISSWERVMNFKDSKYAKEKSMEKLDSSDLQFIPNKDGINYKGMLKEAFKTCDTLMMQYYEIPDNRMAAFGNEVTNEDWQHISHMLIVSCNVFWNNPYEAWFLSKNTLKEISNELNNEQRKFTFLCGHDTNLRTILINLEAEEYHLPETISYSTPIGGKIVVEKRIKDGIEYAAVNFVYASDKQIRNLEILDLDNPPMIYPIKLKGLTANEDGLYLFSDVQARINEAIHKYDAL